MPNLGAPGVRVGADCRLGLHIAQTRLSVGCASNLRTIGDAETGGPRLFSPGEVTATRDGCSRAICPIRGSVSPFVHRRRTFGHFGVALSGFLAVTSPPENSDSKAWTYRPRSQPIRSCKPGQAGHLFHCVEAPGIENGISRHLTWHVGRYFQELELAMRLIPIRDPGEIACGGCKNHEVDPGPVGGIPATCDFGEEACIAHPSARAPRGHNTRGRSGSCRRNAGRRPGRCRSVQ